MESDFKISESMQNKLYLTLVNGTGYVFSAKDYIMLRRKYRIVGNLRGTTVSQSGKASRVVMPVQLTPEETRLLVEQGIALLLSKKESLLRKPSIAEQEEFKNHFMEQVKQQDRIRAIENVAEKELSITAKQIGKRKHSPDTIPPPNIEDITTKVMQNLHNLESSFGRDEKSSFDVSIAFPLPHKAKVLSIKDDDSFKYRVFKDLWLRGYYVTCADVYGGDFLIYSGDPGRYHSSHIINLLPDGKLTALEMISRSRMAVNVRKMCVFAFLIQKAENQTTELKYQSINWNKELNDTIEDVTESFAVS